MPRQRCLCTSHIPSFTKSTADVAMLLMRGEGETTGGALRHLPPEEWSGWRGSTDRRGQGGGMNLRGMNCEAQVIGRECKIRQQQQQNSTLSQGFDTLVLAYMLDYWPPD